MQPETEYETMSLCIQEKDDGKNQQLFDGELDEHVSWESLAAFKKAMRISLDRLRCDGWKHHFSFDLG